MKRLSEPEGEHELHSVLERLRVYPPLWEALHRLHLSDEACPSKLEEWRRAPDGSQEDIWTEYYDEAMGILAMGLQ